MARTNAFYRSFHKEKVEEEGIEYIDFAIPYPEP